MSKGAERLGWRLAQLRNAAGLDAEAVSSEAEVTTAELAAIERGQALPTAKQIEKLAEVFGLSINRLVGMSGTDRPLVATDRIPFFFSGTGRNEEEARLEKERQKTAQVPYFPVELPDDLTAPELEAMMLEWIRLMITGVHMISSIVRAAPDSVAPEMFRHAVLLMLFEMYPDLVQLAYAMENDPQAGPLAFVLCEKRKETWDPSKVKFELKLPQ